MTSASTRPNAPTTAPFSIACCAARRRAHEPDKGQDNQMAIHIGTALRIFSGILALLLCLPAFGQGAEAIISRDTPPDPAAIQLRAVATGFHRPIYATHAGDGSGRFFVLEQSGKIWILEDGARTTVPFLDVSALISPSALSQRYSEQGLLGLAFHPEYASNGTFFIYYTDHGGGTVVARYQVMPQQPYLADPGSGQILFSLNQPYANHNGGHIDFGPDGYLYIALGDGGSANDPLGAGQNRGMLLGTLLRLDVDSAFPYAIPADNPFVDDAAARDEIWAYGLRNVWRFSFDRATGDIYLADVGQNQWEEVNFQPAESRGGENYGWNVYEANTIFAGGSAPNHVAPFFAYRHALGCSVTGGYVYRGSAIPELQAAYLFGDYCTGRIWAAWRDSSLTWQTVELMKTNMAISSFGEDETGEVYVIDYVGAVYRFEPPA
ncbi:MAG: PQQ-dependent sugar dehydrogenase [Chloroflexi bacterium]|nr:PQQ-dependent sugar dehydrogenase [Chloroflexota bacterium]MXX49881.1 PQQ-dependent sugar dehydrogenase [Chloroflexota bacterium]MXX82881.1 PQQ-dependent sugar dehydrogenase [Chloroflexota bacterium]MYA93390.1 PQQ-dependent sugar dehydrogenase [Chloroflexota bacterium]MYC55987.1 PQQ-dependent sugar dehydrogenase [Chloroflexota bacterium]